MDGSVGMQLLSLSPQQVPLMRRGFVQPPVLRRLAAGGPVSSAENGPPMCSAARLAAATAAAIVALAVRSPVQAGEQVTIRGRPYVVDGDTFVFKENETKRRVRLLFVFSVSYCVLRSFPTGIGKDGSLISDAMAFHFVAGDKGLWMHSR